VTRKTVWDERLIAAVDRDNEEPQRSCAASRTLEVLEDAPERFSRQIELAMTDLIDAGQVPISELTADHVAAGFRSGPPGSVNVIVARLLVPGSPWPGHYGLEAVVFVARASLSPDWFPKAEIPLTFAETLAASAAFERGHGSVIFPELLATSKGPASQEWGLVFVDRLARLFVEHVLPLLERLGIPWSADEGDVRDLRQLAFQSHEWGHRSTDPAYAEAVTGHRQRLPALLSEITADVAALSMLEALGQDQPAAVARVLLFDRVFRDALLERAESHVAGMVGLHLAQIMARAGRLVDGEPPTIETEPSPGFWKTELKRLIRIYRLTSRGQTDAARDYLSQYGWELEGQQLTLPQPDPVLEHLRDLTRLPLET
jgi:hypothetical protein